MNNPMRLTPAEKEEERAHAAHVESKLANFGDKAGQHGPLAACTGAVFRAAAVVTLWIAHACRL